MPRFAVIVRPRSLEDLERVATMLVAVGDASSFIERAPALSIATVVDAASEDALCREVRAIAPDAAVVVRAADLSRTARAVVDATARLGSITRNDLVDAPLLRLLHGDRAPIVESIVTVKRRALPFARKFLVVTAGVSADDSRAELAMRTDDMPALDDDEPPSFTERVAAYVAGVDRMQAEMAAAMLASVQSAIDEIVADGKRVAPPTTLDTAFGDAKLDGDDELARVGVRAWRVRITETDSD